MTHTTVPILGFCAYSGTGKTTLLVQLIPLLGKLGLRIGMIKHGHHDFDIDHPGKDSYRLRKAGAQQMLISSAQRYAHLYERQEGEQEKTLYELIERLDQSCLDLILVEGFKREAFPKIELHRKDMADKPYLYPGDQNIIALASDDAQPQGLSIPFLDLNQVASIAQFIQEHVLATK